MPRKPMSKILHKAKRILRRRLPLACFAAILLALCATAGIYLSRSAIAEPPAQDPPVQNTDTQKDTVPLPLPMAGSGVTLSVGKQYYTFTLRTADASLSCGLPTQVGQTDRRALRTRSAYRFPVARDGVPTGAVTLTLDQSVDGTVFYVQSDAPAQDALYLDISAAQDDALTVRPVSFGRSAAVDADAPTWDEPYPGSAALYLEGDGVHLRLSRLCALRSLGQTVYTYRSPAAGAVLSQTGGGLRLSLPLTCKEGELLDASGVLTETPGVNWEDGTARQNVGYLDAADTDYHIMADGVYITMPEDYAPRDGDGRHIYRTATAWLLGPCTYDSNGPMFAAIGKSIVYTYLDNVNEKGFLPTGPTSGWLQGDFGIGGGFYDTRFNFDTMKRLMRAETVWDDHEIGETVQRMLDFYCGFADRNQFTFLGHPFVPDYGDAEGDSRGALSSLNHYLAEGLLLLRAGDAYANEGYTARGWGVLDAIDKTYYRWIRDNADLWYGVYPDGWLRRGDYVEVTYLDLIDAAALLDKYGRWEEYEGIQTLLHEKERWLRLAGRPELLEDHPAFTFAD